MNRTAKTIAKMAVIACAAGCQMAPADNSLPYPAAGKAVAGTYVFQQLIIKFKPGTIACDATGIAGFAIATRVRLEFIRPMSGDACVVRQLSLDSENLSKEQIMMRRHPAVEWLEQDAIMKAL